MQQESSVFLSIFAVNYYKKWYNNNMTHILKLSSHDENKEIEFELNYLSSLTTKQRFQMMAKRTKEIRSLLKNHGYRGTFQIIKRT